MDLEIKFLMILLLYIRLFIAMVQTMFSLIHQQIIEITTKDSSEILKIKIGIEEMNKGLAKDINISLYLSILRDRKELQDKIVVINIISKLNNLVYPLIIYSKVFLLMEIFCNNFKWWCQILMQINSAGIEDQQIS
jgi:hypothetical protein